jgi:hypothetical protein
MDTTDVTTQAILATYEKLPLAERRQIDTLVTAAHDGVSRKNSEGKGLGKKAAIELIGKLGLWLVQHGPKVEQAPQVDVASTTS